MNNLQAALEAGGCSEALEADYATAYELWQLYASEYRLSEELSDSQYESAEHAFMEQELGADLYDLYRSTH